MCSTLRPSRPAHPVVTGRTPLSATPVFDRPERERRDRPGRVPQPCAHRSAVCRVGGPKHPFVRVDTPPVGPPVRNHDPEAHRDRRPAAVAGDAHCEPALAIRGADQFLDIHDVCLQLLYEERSPPGVPGELIDDAELAAVSERDLRGEHPARSTPQRLSDGLVQCGVAGVEEPVQLSRPPSRHYVDANVQRRRDATKCRNRQTIYVDSLDERDQRPRDARLLRNVLLPPPAPDAKRAEGSADSCVVHPFIVARGAYGTVIRGAAAR